MGHDEGRILLSTTEAILTLESIRQCMREVRDEKPTGWQAYAAACVAVFEHDEVPADNIYEWSQAQHCLEERARALRPEVDASKEPA